MSRDAQYFDQWYADMARSAVRDRIFEQALGLPPELQSTSLLPWDGIAEVGTMLGVSAGDVLLDLACGRGGYGLEIARRTGARLTGVDFSAVALEEARRHAGDVDADFRTGELTAIPLPDGSADAVLCVDAIQFAEPRITALQECRRVLVAGGRLVLTCWEPLLDDERVPPRLRGLDLGQDLHAAGYADVHAIEKPGWFEQEQRLWHDALAADGTDDPAMQSLQDEARRALTLSSILRRVLATATAPALG